MLGEQAGVRDEPEQGRSLVKRATHEEADWNAHKDDGFVLTLAAVRGEVFAGESAPRERRWACVNIAAR